jgi:hypothetical protein
MPEQLKNRMQQFEVMPPPDAWKNISARLDDDSRYEGLSARMNGYEVAPPAGAWDNIAANITVNNTRSITPIAGRKINFSFLKIAAAAAVAGIIISLWLWTKQSPEIPVAVTGRKSLSPTAPVTANSSASAPAQETPVMAVPRKYDREAVSETPQQQASLPENNDADNDRVLQYAAVTPVPGYREYPIIIRSGPVKDGNGAVIRNVDLLTSDGNYMIVSGPNGQMTRISSKFASVIRYLNDDSSVEEYLDKVIRESDTWKKRFSEWRKKIGESPFIPSSANFLDIVEFKDLIEKNE